MKSFNKLEGSPRLEQHPAANLCLSYTNLNVGALTICGQVLKGKITMNWRNNAEEGSSMKAGEGG